MLTGYTLYLACVFYCCHADQPQKKVTVKKRRCRNTLQNTFVVRVHSILDAARCCWDGCRVHVCNVTSLAGVCGNSRHSVSLWQTLLTGHTFSSHGNVDPDQTLGVCLRFRLICCQHGEHPSFWLPGECFIDTIYEFQENHPCLFRDVCL